MDPVSLIISALTAGAVAALQETAGTAVKDTYQGLVSLVKKKFNQNIKAEAALEGFTEDPETWKKPLEKSLQETGAIEDEKILAASQKLLDLGKSSPSAQKYAVEINGDVQGFVQGDNAKVTMNFNEAKQKGKKKRG